ncbi:LPS translocon maturation chaperone LptM [Cohaesibacter celericrescens]|jgi:predicted small lipoprotein YifL|uniref:Argininosuccinate lyase n=1 Tax=Cohaesibacter celericrescens TaxID=2067669 RepID=A0A2N5XUA9_9HYPH|nr:lipoprotein [Cohaesibacter celericrescens]PLW78060.1 hypothetical protein C0081_06300 [Cohaesibacter celericrescens]
MLFQTSHLAITKTGVKLLILFALATGLTACGQRGPLVAPTANTNMSTDVQDPSVKDGISDSDEQTDSRTKAPDEGFILDPLL